MKTSVKAFGVVLIFMLAGLVGCKKSNKTTDQNNESSAKVESLSEKKVVASTSWIAAFADLAGVDEVEIIAPADLQHPPEYEITVSDIQKINESDYFIYAGFERMMKTLGDAVGNAKMIQITCDNSISTVSSSAMTIAEEMGTQAVCEERVMEYINLIYEAKQKLKESGLEGAKVFCNKNQTYLAKELGLEIVDIFGPGPVTSDQIKSASEIDFDFIIDNVHNPVAEPLAEVSNAKYIVWRNFPEKVERNALINVVSKNIEKLF